MEVAGAQRVMLSQADYFHAKGYSVQAVFIYDKQGLATEWQVQHPYPLISLQGWKYGGNTLANILRLIIGLLRLYILLRNVDVVITFTPHSNLIGLPLAWLAGVKVRLGTHHSHPENVSGLLRWLHGRLTNSGLCTRMICVSSQVRTLAVNDEGADPSKLAVIDNGIYPPQHQSLDWQARQQLRTSLGVKPGEILFLTVGRLMVQKGHAYLLDAIGQLGADDFLFVFVGQGPLEEGLRQQAQRLKIEDKIRFAGVRNDVGQLLEVADVFVQPSLWEGMSLALLEAMFAGLPIVATNIEAATDVLRHERSALLVNLRDPGDLAAALERIAADPLLRERLGRAAKADAEQKYTVDVMGAAYAQLIETLWHD